MSLTTATKRFIIEKIGQKTIKYEINHFARQKYFMWVSIHRNKIV